MSKIPQEVVVKAYDAYIQAFRDQAEPLGMMEAAIIAAEAVRAQGADVEPVAWQFRFRGRDGLWGRWTTTNVPSDPDHIDPNFEKRPLYTTPPAPQPTEADGIEKAAKYIDQQMSAYAQEFGSYDPSTGQTEFNEAGQEYPYILEELAEGIRALAGGEAPSQTDRAEGGE